MAHKTTPVRIRQTKNKWHKTHIRAQQWRDGKHTKIRLTIDGINIELTPLNAAHLINHIADLLETNQQ